VIASAAKIAGASAMPSPVVSTSARPACSPTIATTRPLSIAFHAAASGA